MNGDAMSQVITASRLHDGVAVFRASDGSWAEAIDQAQCLETAEDAKAALAAGAHAEADNIVLDIYLIDVARRGEALVPIRLREAIRASGPTVHPEHGKPGATRPV